VHGCRQLVSWDVGLSPATSATPVLCCQRIMPGTHRILPVTNRRKVGTTSSHHAPYVQGYTRATMAGTKGWGRSATLGLRHGPDSYGRQQWGILRNGRKPDAATPRERRRPSGCKALSGGTKPLRWIAERVTVPPEEAPANYVPAAAVIRRGRALSGIIGRKARVGGHPSPMWKLGAQPRVCIGNWLARVRKRRLEFLV